MPTPLVSCQSLSKSYGSQNLFEDISFSVFPEDRLGLIGPNGAGKSTFIKVILGLEPASDGHVSIKKGLRTAYVPQISHFEDGSIKEILLSSFSNDHAYSLHDKELIVDRWLSKFGFQDDSVLASSLSGGWKKRLSIAQAMLDDPDIIFLDEPTNHLDLEATIWLESFLSSQLKTFVLISHDRSLLHGACNRIVEINPRFEEGIFSIKGDYSFFLRKKEEMLQGQIAKERSLSSKLRREQEWLKSTPKARTTKSQSRMDQAYDLIDEHASLKSCNQQKDLKIDFVGSDRKTRKLITLKNIKKELGSKTLFSGLDLTITSKMRLGVMGANGSGKSTFMKILNGELEPDLGTIKLADGLKCLYFDQEKAKIKGNITLKDALCPHSDFVNFRGQSVHVNGWASRFLFTPDMMNMPIDKLSGGERARLSIARLMLEPVDVLLLDEPTNDLDIPTLETLEETLKDFPGAIVLISHDRTMHSNICTLFLSLDGKEPQFFASYDKWLESREVKKDKAKKSSDTSDWENRKARSRLEKKIEKFEDKLSQLKDSLESESAYDGLDKLCKEIEVLQNQIDEMYIQWDEFNSLIED